MFSSFSAFSFSTAPSAATTLTTVLPTMFYITARHSTTSHGGCTTSLSLSLLYETLFPLYHRDSSSSSTHPFQRLPPLPVAVEAATLSLSTQTASNPSIDRDSSSTCNPGGSTLHRCHRLHHVVLLGQTTLTPGNFPLPLPLLLLLPRCSLREQ